MATATNKQRLLNTILAGHKTRAHAAQPEGRPVLDEFVYAICRESATRTQADQAFRNLIERFFDWNEIRVSSSREVAEALGDISHPEARAQRLIALLQEVFETTFSFDLDSLQKKGLKQAAKQLGRYQAANDFAVAWVTRQALGGHAVPVDPASVRCLRRLGLLEQDADDLEAIRASLEHLVPKARSAAFCDVVSTLAADCCWEDDPNCPSCPLADDCPTARDMARRTVGSARGARPKPR
jgi:endonuclease-3